jgi:predicted DNA repair protein MutK
MASSLFLLLDDIASVLDDVSTMTQVAVKKTAGVLGDDLALNAKQVAGVNPARELAVVWAVARGSALNKAVLVPAALAVSWLAPWAVTPLLMAGGAYLCFEGAEKILHHLTHRRGHTPHPAGHAADAGSSHAADRPGNESERVSGAIRTDFILSAEIIVITLGVVASQPLVTQVGVLFAISAAMTIGVYGLVAAIVKLDDLGAWLATRRASVAAAVGRAIVASAPWLMRALSIAGTLAMFLVGGGIIAHGIPVVHHAVADLAGPACGLAGPWPGILFLVAEGAVGLGVGLALAGVVEPVRRLFGAGSGA